MPHRSLSTALALLFFTAVGATAQDCLGVPTWDGQIAVAGTGNFADTDRLGAEFSVDVTGPAALGVGYTADATDGPAQVFDARISYDFFLLEPAICAVAGVRVGGEGPDVDEQLGVPVGFGLGKRLSMDRLSAIVFAVPQYVWLRQKMLADGEVVTSNEFQAEAGVTLGYLPLYFGGSLVVSTIDDDPAFRIRAGLAF